MLSNSDLLCSLDELDAQFQVNRDPRYAKYALLELCGWIEEAQDFIIIQCANKLTMESFKKHVEEKVRKNSGFDINFNFYPLLSLVIGMTHFEGILKKLRTSGVYFPTFETTVQALKPPRNKLAHTHFDIGNSDKMQVISNLAPTVVKQQASQISLGFSELEIELSSVNCI